MVFRSILMYPFRRDRFVSINNSWAFLKMFVNEVFNGCRISDQGKVVIIIDYKSINNYGFHFIVGDRIYHSFLIIFQVVTTSLDEKFDLFVLIFFHLKLIIETNNIM